AAAVGRDALDRGAAQAVREATRGRLSALRRLEPRAVESRLARWADRIGAACLRPRDGHGARDARLRRRLGGAGQRRRGSRDGGRDGSARPAAGRSALYTAAGLADQGGGSGLLLGLRQRGALAPL